MIRIVEEIDFFTSCNCCHNPNNVSEIHFDNGKSSLVVALCDNCRKELLTVLQENQHES